MSNLIDTKAGQYKWIENWATVPPTENGRTHGVGASKDGRVFVFNQAVPGMLVYSPEGELLESWGDYPGAHGLTFVEEDGVEYLWLADEVRKAVEKVTLSGEVVQSIAQAPHATYAEGGNYVPTWAAVNETRFGGNGDVWVTDGYGSHLVHRYDAKGNYLSTIDGTEGAGKFNCPHGIAFISRGGTTELYVADRGNHRVQVYTPEGVFLRTFGAEFLTSPDGFAPAGDIVIVPELFGRVSLLDAQDGLIAVLGENGGVEAHDGWPNTNELVEGKFNSPHGAGANTKGDIFVVEWRAGGRVIKLEKVS